MHVKRCRGSQICEGSYGFPSNFASKQIFSIAHIGEIYDMLQSTLMLENSPNV